MAAKFSLNVFVVTSNLTICVPELKLFIELIQYSAFSLLLAENLPAFQAPQSPKYFVVGIL